MADEDSQRQPQLPLTKDEVAALPRIDFVTLGMFIIDEIHFLPPKAPVHDILGGAGSYGALGARLFSPPPDTSSVGWIVDKGSDFPHSLTDLINTWNTTAVYREDPQRLTTRGWNGYETAEKRAFRYTTPKKRLTAEDLTPHLLLSRSYHLICSPVRCRDLVADITAARKRVCPPELYTKPIFIWEPVPDLCTPDELLNCTNTLPLVDICSPNHSELAGFMGDDGLDPETGEVSKSTIERSCEQLLASMPLQSFTLVVRAGDKGCYVARNGGRKRQTSTRDGAGSKRRKKDYTRGGLQPDTDIEALFAGLLQDDDGAIIREEIGIDAGTEQWIPAVHQDRAKVVDPTGGGNTFLGGLAVALARGMGVEEAAVWGSIAASFAIEQVGFPELGRDADGNETWNGVRVQDRLKDFQTRLQTRS
ncbi:PfkB family carbohydrate kinase [Colletotrichum musicola]|uniref:PfkB family carbohydrate kinase n=1 Tax=Colletotrichum musicola TaxID=2175873 RepID=A0A8H6K6M0_9PEZI|nr:PfkB family carbohydrate kinase [Colletotrichum musicola]